MDSDFMANFANMLKNGNIPDEVKDKLNSFMNSNTSSTENATQNSTSQTVRTKWYKY
jgi:hypothetical protein